MKKKILSAMILATAFCSTTFAAEVPVRGESHKDMSFVENESDISELSSKTTKTTLDNAKKAKKEIDKAKKSKKEIESAADKSKKKIESSTDQSKKEISDARKKAEDDRKRLEQLRADRSKKSSDTINLMPLTSNQEFSFDQEFALDGAVTGMAHRVAHNLIPLSVEARFFAPHFDAKVHADSISYNGGTIGLKDQLGLGNDNAPELIVKFGGLQLDYIHVGGDGHSTLDNTLRFGGRTFDANSELKSKSDFDYIKLTYGHDLLSVMGNGVGWNAGIATMHWKGEVSGSSYGYHESRSKEYWAPVPMIGIDAHAQIPTLSSLKFYASISGLPLGGFGHFYDFEAGIRYFPIEVLGISAGYRRIDIHLEHDDDYGDLTLNGPYAGLRYEF